MNRGEVWWATDAGTRAERPFLVLTRQSATGLLNALHAVPATRTVRGIPTEVELDRSDGMPDACVLAFDNATLLRKDRFSAYICTLGEGRMRDVCRAFRYAVDCP